MKKDTSIEEAFDCEEHNSAIASLFQLGRQQSYVTYEDILRFVPQPELNIEQLECIFGALLCAGIPYGEDAEHLDDRDGESSA